MALEQEIASAIENDLPNQIGSILKQRLAKAEDDALDLTGARSQIKDLQSEVETLRERERELGNIEAREEAAEAADREHLKREAVLEVKEAYADKGRADMFNLLQAVFKGPVSAPLAFNANLFGNVNTPMGAHSANLSGDVDQKNV